MFAKLIAWIREVINKMINQSAVKQAAKVEVAVSTVMGEAIQRWALMYENKASWLTRDIRSLNLPAAIASEIARLTTLEMDVKFTGGARAKYLEEQFAPVMDKLRERVEYGCAKGGLIFKPYVSADAVIVDYVHADQFYPVAFDSNGNITAAIFADQRQVGDKHYTRLEYHQMEGDGCVIRNSAYRSNSKDTLGSQVSLDVVDDWKELEPEAKVTGINKPLFAYFRYPLANTIDPSSPLGVSCYSRAEDLIKDADVQWSNLLWEFESGQRALYVDSLAFGKDTSGKPILPNKRLYRQIDAGGQDDALFQDWTPTFREANILAGLDAILKRIEYACGLAYGCLSDPQSVDKTATEIKTSKQRTYATVTAAQRALQNSLEQLLWAMDTWATIAGFAPAGTYNAAFEFDDSVVVDKDLQFQQDLRLVTQGVMSKVEFRMRNFGEDEATARKKIQDVVSEQPADLFGQEE